MKRQLTISILSLILFLGFVACKKSPYFFSFGKTNPYYASNKISSSNLTASASEHNQPDLTLLKDTSAIEKEIRQELKKAKHEFKRQVKEAKADTKASLDDLKKLPESVDKAAQPYEAGPSQTVAMLLATLPLLIGFCGIHRFYLGGSKHIIIGVVQLLTFGCCGIWQLVDIIRIATGELKPKSGEYVEKW